MRENFIVRQANEEERARIYEKHRPEREEDAKNALVYIAVADGDIIGRALVYPREELYPIPGKRWLISNIYVKPGHRRKGAATALVDEIKSNAEERGISSLYGSDNATLEATAFWMKQDFTLIPYGHRQEDESKPLMYGNWHHLMSYTVDRRPVSSGESTVVIEKAKPEEIQGFIDSLSRLMDEGRITKSKYDYFMKNRDTLFGCTAKIPGEDGCAGLIIVVPEKMRPPVDGEIWLISLYVEEKYRRRGIGRALVYELYSRARECGIMQLFSTEPSEDNALFWQRCGFDVYFYGVNKDTGKRTIAAMVKVK